MRVGEGGAREHDTFAHALMAEHWVLELKADERRQIAARALVQEEAGVMSRPGSLPGGRPGSSATGFEPAGEEELQRIASYASAAGERDSAVRSAIELGRRRLRAERPREAVTYARQASSWLDRGAVREETARGTAKIDPERLQWLRGQVDFLMGSALSREGRLAAAEVRLRRFLATPEAADSVHGIYAFVRLGTLLIKRGRSDEARRVFERGLALMRDATVPQAPLIRCDFWAYLAFIDAEEGAFEAADEHLAAAAACLEDLAGDPRTVGSQIHLLHNRGALAAERGQVRQAIADFERLIEFQTEAIPVGAHPEAIQALAHYRMLVGDLGTARALLERALRVARRNGNHVAVTATYGTLALVESAAGNWAEALSAAERARRLAEATQHRASWFQALAELGRIHAALGNRGASDRAFEDARVALGESETERGKLGDTEPRYFRYTRAWSLCRRGDWSGASRACEEAMALAAKRRNPLVQSEIELVALEASARGLGAGGRRPPRPRGFASRFAAIEAVLRAEMVRNGLVDLARVRLYSWLAGWDETQPAPVLAEMADHLEAMGAEARKREIAAEFSATPLASLPECQVVLHALAGTGAAAEPGAVASRPARSVSVSPLSPSEPDLPYDRLRITTFGRLAVTRPGATEPVTRSTWGSRKARLLLAYFLAADPESRGVTRDALCEAVWPDSDSLNLERTFRVTMTFLRRALGSGGTEDASGRETVLPEARLLVFRDGRYRLAREVLWCDAHAFDRLASGAAASERGGDLAAALHQRREAFDLYQGEFLADFDEPWIEPRRERYRRQFVQIGTAVFDAAFAGRRFEEGEEVAERIVACDPLAEEGHQLLIRAYLASGRRDAAARQLERCRTILRTEVGIEVSPRTAALLRGEGQGPGQPT